MSEYFGRVPSMDVLARMGEIDAAFTEKKLGQTPQDVQSLAWGFQQTTAQQSLKELQVGDFPNLITQFNSAALRSGHPNAGNNGPGEGGGGSGGGGGEGGLIDCGDVCECIAAGCVESTQGACCRPGGTCSFVTPSECAALSGSFMGFGVQCSQVQCNNPPPPGGGGGGGGTTNWTTNDETSQEGSSSSEPWSDGETEEPNSDPDIGVDPGKGEPKPPVIPPIIVQPHWPRPHTETDDDTHLGDEDCVARNQGGKIQIRPEDQPSNDDVKGCCCPGAVECMEDCKDYCFSSCVPANKRPVCKNIPVRTVVLCPCGPNRVYGEPDPNPIDPRPQPNWGPEPAPAEELPDGTWEFRIPAACCCNGQHPPDTDGDGILSSGIVDPHPNHFNTWPAGEVCIIVDFERRCYSPDPGEDGVWEDADCNKFCTNGAGRCYEIYNGVVATKQHTECKTCCESSV